MIVQCLNIFTCFDVPYAHRCVTGAAYNNVLVVLKAKDAARVSAQCSRAFGLFLIPDFNCVVAQAANNLFIVVLKAIDAFAVFRSTVDFLLITLTFCPVLVYLLKMRQ